MRKVLAVLATMWVLGIGVLATVVLSPAGESPAESGGGALTVLAAYNVNEGQGDLTCGPAGKAGPGAQVAAQAATRAGFTGGDLLTAVAVAGAESRWKSNATHLNDDGSTDYGMWQINSVHAVLLASGDWADPYTNAAMAHSVWAGSGWGAWTTFTSGAYRAYLPAARAALAGAPTVAPCAVGGPAGGADHLTPWTRAMRADVAAHFPAVHDIGCYRSTEDGGEHPRGRACDFMVYTNRVMGARVAAYAQANAGRLHILYVIWRQHIWSPARAGEGWRPMADRGSPTANHMDHVHISVQP